MGRSRRRRHHIGNGNGDGNGHSSGAEPLVVLSETLLTDTLSPHYVPVQGDPSVILAPVLPLEGLDPWAEIRGPALALEDAPAQSGPILVFNDPAQLLLDPDEWVVFEEAEAPEAMAVPERLATRDVEDDALEPAFDAFFESPDEIVEPADETVFEWEDDPAVADFGGEAAEPLPLPDPVASEAVPPAAEVPESGQPAASAAPADATAEPPEVEAPSAPPPPPDPVEILYGEARAASEAGRLDDAKMLYRQLLALHPTHVRARNNLALILDGEGNHKGALAELDRALDIDAENGTLLVNRGALLGAMGRYAAAEHDLKKVLRTEPSHAEALFNLGVVMTKKGLWSEAVPHLKRAVELEPQRASAHYYLGEALNHVDDLAGALAAYQRAAELQPNNPRALYGLGIIFDRLARPDDAAQMYRRSREVGRR